MFAKHGISVILSTLCDKNAQIFILLQFLETFTDVYNVWHIVYQGNLQHKDYWFVHFTCVLLLHYTWKLNCIIGTFLTKVTVNIAIADTGKYPVFHTINIIVQHSLSITIIFSVIKA